MVVNNATTLDKDKAFNILFKSAKNSTITKFIFASVMILLGTPLFILGLITNESLYITCGVLFLSFGVAYLIINIINIIKLPKKIKNNNQEICENGITYYYKFKEQSINVECKTQTRTAKEVFNYKQLKRIFEYNDYYELRLENYEILYVYKTGFENKKMIEFFIKNLSINKKKIKNKIKN